MTLHAYYYPKKDIILPGTQHKVFTKGRRYEVSQHHSTCLPPSVKTVMTENDFNSDTLMTLDYLNEHFTNEPPSGSVSIFLCGPITGLPYGNRTAFSELQKQLERLGYNVLNPHIICHDMPEGSQWSDCVKKSTSVMLTCDMIVMLPCWQKSKGAKLQRNIALELGIPVKWIDEIIPETII